MPYVPERGDIMWLDRYPQRGHEQAGRRPVLVVSPRHYNERGWRLAVACPVTNPVRGQLWEVPVPAECGATGVIVSDQVKSLDWVSRNAEFLSRVPEATLEEVTYRIATLIGA